MSEKTWLIPKPVGQLLGRLPGFPGSILFVTALNLALAKQLNVDVTQMLAGKKLRLCVLDAQWTFAFEWRNNRFVACQNTGVADLTISASAHDFLRLAQRQEDPDTLFFSRRLSMQGDTELGLMVKNTLDALETPVFDLGQWAPDRLLARFATAPARRADRQHTESR